jgi:hypothetical protein
MKTRYTEPLPEQDVTIDELLRKEMERIRGRRKTLREEEEQVVAERQRRWQVMLKEAKRLQGELAAHRQVVHFAVSKDQAELSVNVLSQVGQRSSYFVLSAHNPDDPDAPDFGFVFLRQIGQPDTMFDDPMAALRELTRRIARLLA